MSRQRYLEEFKNLPAPIQAPRCMCCIAVGNSTDAVVGDPVAEVNPRTKISDQYS